MSEQPKPTDTARRFPAHRRPPPQSARTPTCYNMKGGDAQILDPLCYIKYNCRHPRDCFAEEPALHPH